jgi:uncharacterized protein YgbK (DUF1537 family)
MIPLLGCIAVDFTGATDLAGVLVKHGMRTVQMIGVPRIRPPASDAIVVALKTRTVSARRCCRSFSPGATMAARCRLPSVPFQVLLHFRFQ